MITLYSRDPLSKSTTIFQQDSDQLSHSHRTHTHSLCVYYLVGVLKWCYRKWKIFNFIAPWLKYSSYQDPFTTVMVRKWGLLRHYWRGNEIMWYWLSCKESGWLLGNYWFIGFSLVVVFLGVFSRTVWPQKHVPWVWMCVYNPTWFSLSLSVASCCVVNCVVWAWLHHFQSCSGLLLWCLLWSHK